MRPAVRSRWNRVRAAMRKSLSGDVGYCHRPQKAMPKTHAGAVRRYCAISASCSATNSCVSLWFGVQNRPWGLPIRAIPRIFTGRTQVGLQHGLAFVDQLLHHALGRVGAQLELVDHDAFDLQVGTVVGLDFLPFSSSV